MKTLYHAYIIKNGETLNVASYATPNEFFADEDYLNKLYEGEEDYEGKVYMESDESGSSSLPDPEELAHYASRYQHNKDDPEFLDWWTNSLTHDEARDMLHLIMVEVPADILSKHLSKEIPF